MGNKAGYAQVILAALDLRAGQGPDRYLWAEADDDVRALLAAYPDAALLHRIAEIIRGWADEEPRALWERLRAERKARGPRADVDGTAAWIVGGQWSFRRCDLDSGYNKGVAEGAEGTETHNAGGPLTADRLAAAAAALAEYAAVASSNRLINEIGRAHV